MSEGFITVLFGLSNGGTAAVKIHRQHLILTHTLGGHRSLELA